MSEAVEEAIRSVFAGLSNEQLQELVMEPWRELSEGLL